MRNSRLAIALCCAALACKAKRGDVPTSSSAPQSTTAQTVTLGPDAKPASHNPKTSQRALVRRNEDIVVTSPDGGVIGTVFSGASREAIWDPVLDLLWVLHDDKIDVVDARAATTAPVNIVDRVADNQTFSVEVKRGPLSLFLVNLQLCQDPNVDMIGIEWFGTPRLSFQDGMPKTDGNVARARLTGSKWLNDNATRSANKEPEVDDFTDSEARMPLAKKMAHSDDMAECGSFMNFGDTGLRLVVTSAQGDDCREYGCLLYDPATKLFANPLNPNKWKRFIKEPGDCGIFRFDPTNKTYYLLGQVICTVGDSCRSLHGETLGWLTPGVTLGLPTADTTVHEP